MAIKAVQAQRRNALFRNLHHGALRDFLMKTDRLFLILLLVLSILIGPSILEAGQNDWSPAGEQAMQQAFVQSESERSERNLLVLTNAGYGQINGQSTETFIDTAARAQLHPGP